MAEEDLVETLNMLLVQGVLADQLEILLCLDEIDVRSLKFLKQSHIPYDLVGQSDTYVGPGVMWNKAINRASGAWFAFLWSGVRWESHSIWHMMQTGSMASCAVYGPALYEVRNRTKSFVPPQVGLGELAKQLAFVANEIPLAYMLIPSAVVRAVGNFEEDAMYAGLVDWEWVLRLINAQKLVMSLGQQAKIKAPLGEYTPLPTNQKSFDEQIRVLIYQQPLQVLHKIAIVTGLHEGAQVQLCLLNYLQHPKLSQTIGWRRFVEDQLSVEELLEYDLIFFIRNKSSQAVSVSEFLKRHHKKMIYLLDDNWLCAAQDYPQLVHDLGIRSEGYRCFLQMLEHVDQVWVYNKCVEEDLLPFVTNVKRLPINIALKQFHKRVRTDKKIHLGFAGSSSKLEHCVELFKALEKIMTVYDEVELYFKGMPLPPRFYSFFGRIHQEGYTLDYMDYVDTMNEWSYDIMLSPLGNTRYDCSKCINKYLEITASGAVGIYAKVPLYESIIEDGKNGLLVSNEEEAWYKAIEKMILDVPLRERIFEHAYKQVEAEYDTSQVIDSFMANLYVLLDEGRSFKG